MRKLASIRVVSKVEAIEKADRIEKITIGGWTLVAKKGEFKVGDYAIYFEIDSILPSSDNRFNFLSKEFRDHSVEGGFIVNGFKLRTLKFRGQVSQGLALPLHLFPECNFTMEGLDVTGILKIKKYERPFNKDSVGIKADFPSFVSKTDQERCQNLFSELDFNSDEKWEVTLKIDGCSGTYFYNKGMAGVCNRTCELINDGTVTTEHHLVNEKYDILNKLSNLKRNLAIQGEVFGLGCNGNYENLNEVRFAVFNIFNIDKYTYLTPSEAFHLTRILELDYVPILHENKTFKELGITSIEDLLNFANLPSINNPVAEGVVFKSHEREYSFKVINNKYLLNEKD